MNILNGINAPDLIAMLVVVLGLLVFAVNVIVEVTKNVVPFKTDYYVLILSIALSVLAYAVVASYLHEKFIWYYFVGSVFIGFFVCYISQNGWEKFIKLWEQSRIKNDN